MTLLKQALYYNKHNFTVIPCQGKKPIIKWRDFQYKNPTDEQIKAWWSKYPNANISVIVGESKNLTVIDCDSDEVYSWLQENHLPESLTTPIVKSPHGYHLYFKFAAGLSSKRYLENLDIKTDGGVLVVPPSKVNGTEYAWLVSPKQTQIAEIPHLLLKYLKELSSTVCKDGEKHETTKTTLTTKTTFLREGQRDNDLFHVANCLIKGGCSKEISLKVLEILGKNCKPPFSEQELSIKIQSAVERKDRREKTLTQEIYEAIMTTNDNFMTTNIVELTTMTTREDKKKMYVILGRFVKEGLIERVGNRHGIYRRVNKEVDEIDWMGAKMDYLPFWIPLGISEMAGLLPGNISIIAGSKDSGKTAWMMNIAKENRHKYMVYYFNSEMGGAEFRLRASKFEDIVPSQWHNFKLISRADNFSDVIVPGEGNLNIIDYIEISDNFYKVAEQIKKIHDKLNGALAFVALQKNIGVDLGRGGSFSLEKARLYLSLDKGVVKIISAKNFKQESAVGNPAGYKCRYKLVGGAKILKADQIGWHREGDGV